ncbi:unnamed protein product [Effrenium voratum]|uniref:Uncharacterized protein n=1 Tax=Effrenium voratum TaxID=2562239 RepID=A0AA36HXA2_9DINO|nr:unnamed protein product [Effrenium voratum]
MHTAAEAGDMERCRALVEEGAAVNDADVFKRTPLINAVVNGHARSPARPVRPGMRARADLAAADRSGWTACSWLQRGQRGVKALTRFRVHVARRALAMNGLIEASLGRHATGGWPVGLANAGLGCVFEISPEVAEHVLKGQGDPGMSGRLRGRAGAAVSPMERHGAPKAEGGSWRWHDERGRSKMFKLRVSMSMGVDAQLDYVNRVLHSSEWSQRRKACEVAAAIGGSIGRPAQEALSRTLINVTLNDGDAEVRHAAVCALATFDPEVRVATASELCTEGLRYELESLHSSRRNVKSAACNAMGVLGPECGMPYLQDLQDCLRDKSSLVKKTALAALGAWGLPVAAHENARIVVQELGRAVIGDRDPGVRAAACDALGRILEGAPPLFKPPEAEPEVVDEDSDEEPVGRTRTRTESDEELEPTAVAVRYMVRILHDDDYASVRRAAAAALGSIGGDVCAAQAECLLVAALQDKDKEVRLRAAESLAKLGAPSWNWDARRRHSAACSASKLQKLWQWLWKAPVFLEYLGVWLAALAGEVQRLQRQVHQLTENSEALQKLVSDVSEGLASNGSGPVPRHAALKAEAMHALPSDGSGKSADLKEESWAARSLRQSSHMHQGPQIEGHAEPGRSTASKFWHTRIDEDDVSPGGVDEADIRKVREDLLRVQFGRLDATKKGYLSPADLADLAARFGEPLALDQAELLCRLSPVKSKKSKEMGLRFEAFYMLMSPDDESQWEDEVLEAAAAAKRAVRAEAKGRLRAEQERKHLAHQQRIHGLFAMVFDLVTVAVIISNALVMGVSADILPESNAWDVTEVDTRS